MMKYKVGDKFIVEIKKVDAEMELHQYKLNDDDWWSEDSLDNLQPYHEPVWRDGAMEQPTEEKRIYKLSEDKTYYSPMHPSHFPGYDWNGVYWLYVDEMSMPAMPKQEIVPCPFCHGKCDALCNNNGIKDYWWVFCFGKCGYCSGMFDTEAEAIEAHNKVCGGAK
jgi:hypothetical protein